MCHLRFHFLQPSYSLLLQLIEQMEVALLKKKFKLRTAVCIIEPAVSLKEVHNKKKLSKQAHIKQRNHEEHNFSSNNDHYKVEKRKRSTNWQGEQSQVGKIPASLRKRKFKKAKR